MLQSSTTNDDSSLEATTTSTITRTATKDRLENMGASMDEPPSKKLRLESLSGPSPTPGTPVDDVDDLYDTPGQSNTPPRCEQQQQHHLTVAAAEDGAVGSPPILEPDPPLPISTLPGLGLLGSVGPRNVSDAAVSESILAPSTPVPNGHGVMGEAAEPIEAIESMTSINVQDRSSILHVLPSIEDGTLLDAPGVTASGGDSAEEGQWEVDSSAPASSTPGSSSASADDEDDDDDDDADDYQLLGPEEQARMLMQGDGGSDDEGDAGRSGKTGLQPKTKNEVIDERVDRTHIDITSDLKIEMLGHVESVVGSLIVVRAKVSGTHRVLESGSVLCTEDRRLVGTVSETLGRVQQPYYAVRFNSSDEIADMGLTVASKVFYVERHSTYVFPDALKAIKGSDASNINDEEVAEDELEFSDDEAEAAYKRRVKHERQSRRDARHVHPPSGGPPRSGGAVRSSLGGLGYDDRPSASQDVEIDDGAPYTPLARPSNYQALLGNGHALEEEEELASAGPAHGRGHRGARGQAREYGRGRGRGGRGGRGGRARGRARGGWSDHGRGGFSTGRDAPTEAPSQPMNPSYAISTMSEHQSSPGSAPLVSPFGPAYEYLPQTVALLAPTTVTSLPAALPVAPAYPAMPYGWYPTALSPASPLVPAPPAPAPVNAPPVINAGMPLPAGAFVNPAFFRRSTTTSPLFASAPDPSLSNSDAAFRAAQEQLDLLKSLQQRSSGSP